MSRVIPICFGLVALLGDFKNVYVLDPFYIKVVFVLLSHRHLVTDVCLTNFGKENGLFIIPSFFSHILFILQHYNLLTTYAFLTVSLL